MNTAPSPAPAASVPPDPRQKKKLIQGVMVWVGGVLACLAMIPVVNSTGWSTGVKGTLNTLLLVAAPKIFLFAAIAIMGKPGFAYLKSLIKGRLTPPAVVSPARYRLGLIMLVSLIVLGSLGPYMAADIWPYRQQHPHLIAGLGDLLIVVSLFILGGDFWDKLRALFVREAKAVFPAK